MIELKNNPAGNFFLIAGPCVIEGDKRLIMDNDWTTIIFKYKENMDDYTLWDKILSNEN